KEQLINLAVGVTQGRIELFGWKPVSVSIPTPEFHNRDSSRIVENWASSYYWDINFYHSHDHPEFDVKWLWELQRFQFLLWLGAAWKLTADNKFAYMAREILNSWMRDIKYPFGVEWSSNLEVGLRLLSISRCHIMCMDASSWDTGFLSKLVAWQYLHGIHVREELTLHHTLGNHPLGEASSLLWFALTTPSLNEAPTWKAYAFKIINKIIPKLFFHDGVYVEQSTCYLKFVSEFMLPLILLDSNKENRFSYLTRERIKSCLEFIRGLSDHGERTPMIGDSDSGAAIGWRLSDYWDFSWLLAAGSILLNEPCLATGIDKLPAETFLNVGLAGLNKFRSFSTRPNRPFRKKTLGNSGHVDFPAGGYHVSYDSLFRMIFDSGPLGIYPGFGHGHADGLSILLNIRGKPVVVDSGTMHYNAEPKVRGYFRKTHAHNTLVVNGHNQADTLDSFKWASGYRIQWNAAIEKDEFRFFSGLLESDSFIHQREIVHFFEKGFIIKDWVEIDGNITVEGFLHFAPSVCVEASGKNKFLVSIGDENLEIIFSESGVVGQILKGMKEPMQGWYSIHYGEMVPTYCLRFFHTGTNHCEMMTTISCPNFALEWPDDFRPS
ncbi:MAG: alginate lyase family protein, partial [Pseudomonadota bacterium]